MIGSLLESWTQRALDNGRGVPAPVRWASALRPAWRKRIDALSSTHDALLNAAARQHALLSADADPEQASPALRLAGDTASTPTAPGTFPIARWLIWPAAAAAVLGVAAWLSWGALNPANAPQQDIIVHTDPNPERPEVVDDLAPPPEVAPAPPVLVANDPETPNPAGRAPDFAAVWSPYQQRLDAWSAVSIRVDVSRAELLGRASATAVEPLRREWDLLVSDLNTVVEQVGSAWGIEADPASPDTPGNVPSTGLTRPAPADWA